MLIIQSNINRGDLMVLDFNYQDIVDQCNAMVYLNTVSYCMLSGCGNIELPQENELEKMYALMGDIDEHKKPGNIFFMSSLYKRCMPVYSQYPETAFDFNSFQWIHKKARKIVKPDIMSYSIYCLSLLSKKIRDGEISIEHKDFMEYCLLNTAMKQAQFCRQFLKIGDLYYSGEDISDNSYGEYQIEINPDDASLLPQLFMLEAFSMLIKCARDRDFFSIASIQGLEGEFKLIPALCNNITENINMIKSRDLSLAGLSLINLYKSSEDYKHILYDTSNMIGCELNERLYTNGDIGRNIIDRECSSFITLCNSLRFFVKLHEINPMDFYSSAIAKIYDRIDSFWNDNMGLFININEKKVKYTIKDIGYVFAALKALRDHFKESELCLYVEKQLSGFYRAALVNSKIFNNQAYPILQNDRLELHTLGTLDKKMAPVFMKEFEIKINKKKYYCQSGIMRPEYVMCGCKQLLT
ncbi:MAG: hypothetical protein ACOZCL_07345 [Bacillota bacterium]